MRLTTFSYSVEDKSKTPEDSTDKLDITLLNKSLVNMFGMKSMSYSLCRNTTLVTVIGLIVLSVYYLSSTLELLKGLAEHIQEAERMHEKHSAINATIGRIMFEPLVESARNMYNKHELNAIVNIVTYSLLIGTSIGGLTATLRKSPILMIIYAITLDAIYCSTFLYVSRIKPHISAGIVLVSILVILHARQIRNYCSSNSNKKLRLHETNSNQQLIKEQFVHANEIV